MTKRIKDSMVCTDTAKKQRLCAVEEGIRKNGAELTCVMNAQPALEHLAQAQDLRQRPVAALEPREALVDEQVDLRSEK